MEVLKGGIKPSKQSCHLTAIYTLNDNQTMRPAYAILAILLLTVATSYAVPLQASRRSIEDLGISGLLEETPLNPELSCHFQQPLRIYNCYLRNNALV